MSGPTDDVALKLLRAWFHDPPDKALKIPGHESRAAAYLRAASVGLATADVLPAKDADIAASVADRIPMPHFGSSYERAVSLDAGMPYSFYHPVSGNMKPSVVSPPVSAAELATMHAIQQIAGQGPSDSPMQRFMRLWRLLPDNLQGQFNPRLLPADTRVPDHNIWNHLDITAALHVADNDSAFLVFQLGPVQEFIAMGRSTRDLWAGSAILSWLTFKAMLPVIEKYGPTAIVMPLLRGNPLMDIWLREKCGDGIPEPGRASALSPCLPNRFLAVVPASEAESLAQQCTDAVRTALRQLAAKVCDKLSEVSQAWAQHMKNKGARSRFDKQYDSFFDFRTVAMPFRDVTEDKIENLLGRFDDAFKDASNVRKLAELIPQAHRPGYAQNGAGTWQMRLELVFRVMEATRAIAHVPKFVYVRPDALNDDRLHDFSHKCSLFGSYDRLGPTDPAKNTEFWKRLSEELQPSRLSGLMLKEGEAFCALAVIKRFAPLFIARDFGTKPEDLKFDDTTTVAEESWSRLNDRKRPRPTYYAVLSMDGDSMGKWLQGRHENAPSVGDIMHPKLRDYFSGLKGADSLLQAKKPVGPAYTAAISEALANFAVHIAPPIVEKYDGTLIYCGGDDLLALLPARNAVQCAMDLRHAFTGGETGWYTVKDGRELLTMGPRAGMSAGIAIVHTKNDLRHSIAEAHRAEKEAKNSGRDRICVSVSRRNGSPQYFLLPYSRCSEFDNLVRRFDSGASDRWAYHFAADAAVLAGLGDIRILKSELGRRIGRAEDKAFNSSEMDGLLELCLQLTEKADAEKQKKQIKQEPEHKVPPLVAATESFVNMIQTASFLTRGRDE